MTITYRRATLHDIDTITDHRIKMFTAMGRGDAPLTEMATAFKQWAVPLMQSDQFITILAQNAQHIIGGGGMLITPFAPAPHAPQQTHKAHIYNIYVEETHRRQGIARQLMHHLINECRQRRIVSITLNASDDGRALYQSMGFRSNNHMMLNINPDTLK